MRMKSIITLLAVAGLTACGPQSVSDHGHPHGDDAHGSEAAAGESWAVTAWGRHFELFPEIDALVAGESAGSHVHVTLLSDFSPIIEGSVTIILKTDSGVEERFHTSTVVRPGIFTVDLTPETTGERNLEFAIDAGGFTETIDGGRVRVGTPDQPGGLVEAPFVSINAGGDEEVDFLKEQQWRTTFDTQWAEAGAIKASISGTARIEPPSGGNVVVTASVDGIVQSRSWPHTGQATKAGTTVMSLLPTAPTEKSLAALSSVVQAFEAQKNAATSRLERLQELLTKEAVSKREVEQARADLASLEARLEAGHLDLAAAEAGRTGRHGVGGLVLKAPFKSRVAEVMVSPGEHVTAGDALFRLVSERPVWVLAALTPHASSKVAAGITGLILQTGASSEPVTIDSKDLRLVAVAPEVDPSTGTVETIFEVQRSVDELKPGLHVSAEILLSKERSGLVLPDTAVVDDAGVPVVYIQQSGESFARRPIDVRHRQGRLVLVGGVVPGERVVTVGGAAIRRASLLASGSVEGHVH